MASSKLIGLETTYIGDEHPYLTGYKVKIIAVLPGGADPDIEPDRVPVLTTDAEVAQVGGITARDRVEIQPWLEEEGRWSFVTSDPRVIHLECFAHLAQEV